MKEFERTNCVMFRDGRWRGAARQQIRGGKLSADALYGANHTLKRPRCTVHHATAPGVLPVRECSDFKT